MIKVQETLGGGLYLQNALWADADAGTASNTSVAVDDRITFRTHLHGIEQARPDTVPMPKAANVTRALTAVKEHLGPAALRTLIEVFDWGAMAACAWIAGGCGFGNAGLQTHDLCNGLGRVRAGNHTDICWRLAPDDRPGCRRASCKSAAAAVGPC